MSKSTEPLGYARDGDIVTLRMTIDDYYRLLVALGIAAGSAPNGNLVGDHLALVNRLNENNLYWTPYELPDCSKR